MKDSDITSAPVLQTERLTLRGHHLDDFALSAAMWADPIVTRYIGGAPPTDMMAWSRVLRYVGHWALMGFGYWVVEDKAAGMFVGEVGFADFKRDIQPSIKGVPELGWVISPPYHGRGYATEAVRAAVAWGDANLRSKRTVCIIDPRNAPSISVAGKCDYRELLHTTYAGEPTIMYERIAP
ncbi:MAG TPA: GNAT family N-acetyltransferase [Candidatus Eremiobacteraceae bacterium]|nr:GNAT family N-acetyltransferase [Candidatus Eremiobacteraceae bacterium]